MLSRGCGAARRVRADGAGRDGCPGRGRHRIRRVRGGSRCGVVRPLGGRERRAVPRPGGRMGSGTWRARGGARGAAGSGDAACGRRATAAFDAGGARDAGSGVGRAAGSTRGDVGRAGCAVGVRDLRNAGLHAVGARGFRGGGHIVGVRGFGGVHAVGARGFWGGRHIIGVRDLRNAGVRAAGACGFRGGGHIIGVRGFGGVVVRAVGACGFWGGGHIVGLGGFRSAGECTAGARWEYRCGSADDHRGSGGAGAALGCSAWGVVVDGIRTVAGEPADGGWTARADAAERRRTTSDPTFHGR